MKKFINFLVLALLFIPSLFIFTACNNNNSNQEIGTKYELTIDTAYALAEERGYVGTLEEFIEAIKGDTGVGIERITYLSSNGLTDTYEIILTNTSKVEFTVTNGKDGNGFNIKFGFIQSFKLFFF